MNFWVLDNAKLLNILLDGMGLGAYERVDQFGCANGHTHSFQTRYSDDIKLGFCKILFIEFHTESLERVVMVNVLEHKFASSLSGDTGDVNFDFGHVETLFRVLSKPLAHLNQHLVGCLEGDTDVQIVSETNPASITMAGEHATHDGVLRQTITHHLQSIPLLTVGCAIDVMRVPAVITVSVVGGGAVHGVEVSKERT